MAQIIKKGNKYMVRVTWYDSTGKQHKTSKSGFATKASARKYGAELELKKYGQTIPSENPVFTDCLTDTFNIYKRGHVKASTERIYLYMIDIAKQYFQSTLAKDIKKRDFQLFINSLSPRYSTSTINLVVKAIRNLVKLAVSDHVISENFTTGIMQPKKTDRTIEYLNTEELSKLTRYITNNLNPEYRADYIILTAIYTGARLGEILGLTWEDINFNFKTITINKAWNHTTKSISTTKNTSSNRTIPVNDELLSALKQLKVNHTQYLFLENHVSYSVIVNTRLRKLLTTCNIEKQSYHFHSLRHTHVAYLLANNIPLAVIAKRLGHANTTTTANTYAYLIEEFEDKTNRDILNSLGVLNGVPTSKLSNTANNRK